MDFATALMLICVGLYSEVESPVGHVGLFGPYEEGQENTAAPLIREARLAFEMFERRESRRPPEQQDELRRALWQRVQRANGELPMTEEV